MSTTVLRGPRNRTVFSHSTVRFSCTLDTQKEIYWEYDAGDGSYFKIFDSRGRNEKKFDSRFERTVNGTTSTLVIYNVNKSDEGTYICLESDTSGNRWFAQLTVTGK